MNIWGFLLMGASILDSKPIFNHPMDSALEFVGAALCFCIAEGVDRLVKANG